MGDFIMKCLKDIKNGWLKITPKEIIKTVKSKTDDELVKDFSEYRFPVIFGKTPEGVYLRMVIRELYRRKILK